MSEKNTDMGRVCGECVYFMQSPGVNTSEGYCRRNPPILKDRTDGMADYSGIWNDMGCCGEFVCVRVVEYDRVETPKIGGGVLIQNDGGIRDI
jgi:hypothetical protein